MAKQPQPWRSLTGEVGAIKKDTKNVSTRSPWFNSGARVDGNGGIQSDDFDGDLNNSDAGTTGWALNAQRAAFGELVLRPGSIGNDSLANPVDGKVGNVSATGFSLTVAFKELAYQSIVVPDNFTQALVSAGATVFSYNPNTTGGSNGAGGDAIYCYVGCNGQASHPNPVGVSGGGGYATSFSQAGFNLSGLTGGDVIRLSVFGSSAYAGLAANPDNYANAFGTVTFLR